MAHTNSQNHPGTVRLEFLDGLRGLAAAMVVFHHLPSFVAVPVIFAAIVNPNPWVAVFITLSGFCLYLPAAGRAQVEMPRPFWEFMRRRARRILPPWYASLALCWLLGWFFAVHQFSYAQCLVPANVLDVLYHLTLTHSMTAYSGHINGPGYTLGTEFQLYVLMILLVAVAARAGWAVLIAVAILSVYLPGPAGKVVHHLFSPIFGLPFIIGMLAARLARRQPTIFAARPTVERRLLGFVFLAAVALFGKFSGLNFNFACWTAGAATGAACILMSRRPEGIAARLLSSQAGKSLGGFSYSLYLTHVPLLILGAYLAQYYALPPTQALVIVFLPGLVAIFVFAYLFSLVFERPFLNSKPAPRPAPAMRRIRPEALAPDADAAGIQ